MKLRSLSCYSPSTIVLALLAMAASACFADPSIQTGMAQFQIGSPVQVIGLSIDTVRMDLVDSVTLMNASDKIVVSCRLGWVYRSALEDVQGQVAIGREMELHLGPNSLVTAGSQGVGIKAARDIFKAKGIQAGEIVVGVVEVKFQDGTSWSYPLASKGRFEVEQSDDLRSRMVQLLRSQPQKAAVAAPNAEFGARAQCVARTGKNQEQLSLLDFVYKDVKSWFVVEQAHAQSGCPYCYITVCNPGTSHCSCPSPNTCNQTSCNGPYDTCTVACGVVPSYCPGC